jgi:hypothetical protein
MAGKTGSTGNQRQPLNISTVNACETDRIGSGQKVGWRVA